MDVSMRYQLTKRVSVLGSLPIVFNHYSQLFPTNGAGIRQGWSATGIGDTSLYVQRSLFEPRSHPFGNTALGIGIKIPTGSWNLHADLPDETGANYHNRSIYPPAIYPGDGGTGILLGYDTWKILRFPTELRGVTIFSSAMYLINPRDTNGTPSIIQGLGVPLTPNLLNKLTNSVTDSWSMSAGAAIRVPGTWTNPKLKNFRLRAAWHWEGIPTRDLFGRSDGFRQPGYTMSFAPGFTYAIGKHFLSVEVPIVFWRHINPGATYVPGLPVQTPAGPQPAAFNPNRNLGLVPPVAVAVRYVRSL